METEPIKAEPPKRKRRWFQFSLRTLMVVTLIVAIACAWIAHRMEQKRLERDVVEAIVKSGGEVQYDYQTSTPPGTAPEPAWLRSTLGENFFSDVVSVRFHQQSPFEHLLWPNADDSLLAKIKVLTRLKELSLFRTNVTDAGLTKLGEFTELQELDLRGTSVTDAGMVRLEKLTSLKKLWLDWLPITDAGLSHIKRLVHLENVGLSATRISDAGLASLDQLRDLKLLDLSGSDIGNFGLEHLDGLSQLRVLNLADTRLTDTGLANVERLSNLESLVLTQSYREPLDIHQITDRGLGHLKGLARLRTLSLSGKKVTDAGVSDLQKALPNCTITRR